jgi:hypothetical protein
MLSILLVSAGAAQAQVIAGYEAKGSGSVKEHNEIDLDQAAMETALGASDWTTAKTHYSVGGNSKTSSPYRTLQGFSTGAKSKMYDGCPGCPYTHYKQFYDFWNAAGNTPFQARVYSEDGEVRPINVVLETPRGPSTVAVRNIGQMEFPMNAEVDEMYVPEPSPEHQSVAQYIQGGALKTFPMDPAVEAVEVLLTTDGMPMNARVEILQGPDTNKQVIELYSENGMDRPFFCTFATPWSGNVIRILNTGPLEYPLAASIVPAGPSGR